MQEQEQEAEMMNVNEFNVHRLRAFMRVLGCCLRAFMRVVLKRLQRFHRLRAFMRVKVAEQEQEQRSGKADNTTFVNTFTAQNPHSGWSPAPAGVLVARALGRQIGTRQWQRGWPTRRRSMTDLHLQMVRGSSIVMDISSRTWAGPSAWRSLRAAAGYQPYFDSVGATRGP